MEVSYKLADTSASLFACMDNRSLDILTKYLPPSTTPKVFDYSLLNDLNHPHDDIPSSSWLVTYFDTHPTEDINYQLWSFLKQLFIYTKVRFKFRPDATLPKKLKFSYSLQASCYPVKLKSFLVPVFDLYQISIYDYLLFAFFI